MMEFKDSLDYTWSIYPITNWNIFWVYEQERYWWIFH
ncbi:hypothetical protein T09_2678 [Trichinella sp. T9]|nr:hypothetical protein T09_2678 [Trichinella sp. T9]